MLCINYVIAIILFIYRESCEQKLLKCNIDPGMYTFSKICTEVNIKAEIAQWLAAVQSV